MKVVLLAGGLGSRLAEETQRIPKPMVEVAGRPIMLHVMDIYAKHGLCDFVVACGYKAVVMKRFFQDLHLMGNDLTVSLGDGGLALAPLRDATGVAAQQRRWNISVVDTGLHTMTGGRLRRLRDWIGGETFMVTYSDGVGNIDIDALLAFHNSHGRLATVTAVQPPARFGSLDLGDDFPAGGGAGEGGPVRAFTEKINAQDTWINGGFFVFEPEVLDYVDGDGVPLEKEPLARMAEDGQLAAFKHRGFWHPMDTLRDKQTLERLAADPPPPWMREDVPAVTTTDALPDRRPVHLQ